MNRPTNFIPHPSGNRTAKTVKDAADFLRAHDRMAAILPAVTRLAALQKDCAALFPTMFETCSVLHFDAGQLILATPNAALAARLKQQLPKLQDGLLQRGWQVNAIRIKLQVAQPRPAAPAAKQLALPQQALASLASLGNTLEDTPRNQALKNALAAMVRRHMPEK